MIYRIEIILLHIFLHNSSGAIIHPKTIPQLGLLWGEMRCFLMLFNIDRGCLFAKLRKKGKKKVMTSSGYVKNKAGIFSQNRSGGFLLL